MKLTDHFTLEELIRSSKAKALKIDNTPTEYELNNMKKLCEQLLEPIRLKWGKAINVTSGYRCPKLNKAVGGSPTSQHTAGSACDLKPANGEVKQLFNMIKKMLEKGEIECRQLIDEYNYTWIHISINDDKHTYKKNQIIHIR